MSIRVDVVSIGTLAKNLLWNEQRPVRTAHATCSVIRTAKRTILVDPGLPAVVIVQRLKERLNLSPDDITDVFITHVSPVTTRGLDAFADAAVFTHELEIEHMQKHLESAGDTGSAADNELLNIVVDRLKPAPDKLAPGVDLYPLFGFTPGTSGLLVVAPVNTTLLTGPAVATREHYLAGQILPECVDYKTARESLAEVLEIAEIIVPGFDNFFLSPRQFGA